VQVKNNKERSLKVLSDNRTARHNYHLSIGWKRALVLTGTESRPRATARSSSRTLYGEVSGETRLWLANAHDRTVLSRQHHES